MLGHAASAQRLLFDALPTTTVGAAATVRVYSVTATNTPSPGTFGVAVSVNGSAIPERLILDFQAESSKTFVLLNQMAERVLVRFEAIASTPSSSLDITATHIMNFEPGTARLALHAT
jgi:hypothetical protein